MFAKICFLGLLQLLITLPIVLGFCGDVRYSIRVCCCCWIYQMLSTFWESSIVALDRKSCIHDWTLWEVGGRSTYSKATNTQSNDTMPTEPDPAASCLALHFALGMAWGYTNTFFGNQERWSCQDSNRVQSSWCLNSGTQREPFRRLLAWSIHFQLKILHPEREAEGPAWEGSAQIQICGWTTRNTHCQLIALLHCSSAASKNEQEVKSQQVKKVRFPHKANPQRRGLDHTA